MEEADLLTKAKAPKSQDLAGKGNGAFSRVNEAGHPLFFKISNLMREVNRSLRTKRG